MATPPTRVSYHVQSTTPFLSTGTSKTCTGVTFQVGDYLEVKASAEQHGTSATVTPTLSAGAATWTKYADQGAAGANNSGTWSWVGVVTTAATNATVTLARPTGSNIQWGFTVSVIRGSSGIGVRFEGNNGSASGAPSVTQAVQANSLLTCQVNDWNATDGTSRTWRTVNGSPITEASYYRSASTHTVYGGYVADSGAGGSVTMGLTAPATQRWVMSGFEFLGTTASSSPGQGSGSGSIAFSGLATGKRSPKGAGSGSVTITGSASGTTTRRGSGSGTLAFVGAATGKRSPKASGSGSLTFAGSATGSAPAVGSAAGSGAGSLAWTGSATGKRSPKASASGAVAWASTATGRTSRSGSGSGGFTFTGSGAGFSPSVDGASGFGSGAVAWQGSAAGRRSPVGSGAGVLTLVGSAVGSTVRRGVATGQLAWSGSAVGLAVPPPAEVTARILSATLAIPAATGSITIPAATGDLVSHRASGRLSILRAKGVIA